MHFNHEPTSWGPGMWLSIHIHAYRADNMLPPATGRSMFVVHMTESVAPFLPCLKCREHCKEYIQKTDPIKNLLKNLTVPRSCSTWAWKFHNAVNDRLGKLYKPSLNEVWKYISDLEKGKGCDDCAISSSPPHATTTGKEEVDSDEAGKRRMSKVKKLTLRRQNID